jgi:hypothetical protein
MNQRDIEERGPTPANDESTQPQVRTYDRWQLFYLDRLHRLASLNKDSDAGLLDEDEVRMLRRAIFHTLLDCEYVGVSEEAKTTITVAD